MKKKQPYSNKFNTLIQCVEPNKRIFSYVLDILSVAVLTIILYFASFNLIFKPIFNYNFYNQIRKNILISYSITLTNNDDYLKYESVVKIFISSIIQKKLKTISTLLTIKTIALLISITSKY